MSLRDLIVSIDFDDIEINRLVQMDTAINQIETNLTSLDTSITSATTSVNRLGTSGGSAMDELRTEATQTETAIDQLGDATQQTSDEIRSEITQAETAMDELGDAANQAEATIESSMSSAAGSVHEIESSTDRAGEGFGKLKGVAVAAIAAIAVSVGGLITAIGGMSDEMDQAFDRLEAKTGTTGAQLEGLQEAAKGVYMKGFGEEISDVSDNVAVMRAMFGDLNNNELQGLTEGAYTISGLWDAEVKQVGKTVKTMTSTFEGLSQTDAMDLMTKAFQKTGDYSDDLLDTFNEYSVYFQKMGFDAEGFTNLLVKGAEAGAFTMDKAGDAIKEFGIRSIDASDSTAEGFKAVGLDAELMTDKFAAGGDTAQQAFAATVAGLANMKDPVKQNAAGVALFGTQWEDLRETVVLSMSDGKNALGEFKGSTDAAAEAMQNNFGTQMTQILRELKVALVDAFNDAGGQEMLNNLATKMRELVPVVQGLLENVVSFAGTVRENWPLIQEILIGVGTFVGILAAVKGTIILVTAAQWAWNAAMTANPIGLIITAIAAVIAIGVVLYRNWDTVKTKAVELWDKLGVMKGAVLALLGPFGTIIGLGISIYKNWDTIKAKGIQLWNSAKEVFGKFGSYIMEKLQPLIGFFEKLGDKWDKFKSSISNFKMPKIGLPKWMGGEGLIQTDGSHATGLGKVPWDGYVAELHKDEAVLTARQANGLRNAGILSGDGSHPNMDMSGNMAPSGPSGGGSVFSPNLSVEVYVNGGDGQDIADKVKEAVNEQMEKFWRRMNFSEA